MNIYHDQLRPTQGPEGQTLYQRTTHALGYVAHMGAGVAASMFTGTKELFDPQLNQLKREKL